MKPKTHRQLSTSTHANSAISAITLDHKKAMTTGTAKIEPLLGARGLA